MLREYGFRFDFLHLIEFIGLSQSRLAVFLKQSNEVRDRPLCCLYHCTFIIEIKRLKALGDTLVDFLSLIFY
jgi:hypothetical protein